jgi:hypothetical protein
MSLTAVALLERGVIGLLGIKPSNLAVWRVREAFGIFRYRKRKNPRCTTLYGGVLVAWVDIDSPKLDLYCPCPAF